jgi:transcriptional regulator with XRE-family HTH domain
MEVRQYESFGELLRAARIARGFTFARLAGAVGVSLGMVQQYEAGKKSPSLVVAVRLVTVLGVWVPVAEPTRIVGWSPDGCETCQSLPSPADVAAAFERRLRELRPDRKPVDTSALRMTTAAKLAAVHGMDDLLHTIGRPDEA